MKTILASAIAALVISTPLAASAATIAVTTERQQQVFDSTDGIALLDFGAERLSSSPYRLRVDGKADAIALPLPFLDVARSTGIYLFAGQLDVEGASSPLQFELGMAGLFAFVGTPIIGGEGSGVIGLNFQVADSRGAPVFALNRSCSADSGFLGTDFVPCAFSQSQVVPFDSNLRTLRYLGLLLLDAQAESSQFSFQTTTSEAHLTFSVVPVPEPATILLMATVIAIVTTRHRHRGEGAQR